MKKVLAKQIRKETNIVKDDVFETVVNNIYNDPRVISISWEPAYTTKKIHGLTIREYNGMQLTISYVITPTTE